LVGPIVEGTGIPPVVELGTDIFEGLENDERE
jgi:hypothetical protein